MESHKGFSLIELMITVAIIGVLVLIAYPSYRSYISRIYIAEGLNLLASFDERAIDTINNLGVNYENFNEKINPGVTSTGWMVSASIYNRENYYIETFLQLDTKAIFGIPDMGMDLNGSSTPEITLTRAMIKKDNLVLTNTDDGVNFYRVKPLTPSDLSSSENFIFICGLNTFYVYSTAMLEMSNVPKECRNFITLY